MLESYCRPQYQRWLVTPVAARIGQKITPNQITYLAGFTGVMVLPALFLIFQSLQASYYYFQVILIL